METELKGKKNSNGKLIVITNDLRTEVLNHATLVVNPTMTEGKLWRHCRGNTCWSHNEKDTRIEVVNYNDSYLLEFDDRMIFTKHTYRPWNNYNPDFRDKYELRLGKKDKFSSEWVMGDTSLEMTTEDIVRTLVVRAYPIEREIEYLEDQLIKPFPIQQVREGAEKLHDDFDKFHETPLLRVRDADCHKLRSRIRQA